jgi:hypothetical protein
MLLLKWLFNLSRAEVILQADILQNRAYFHYLLNPCGPMIGSPETGW